MSEVSSETVQAEIQPPGFTFVEEDDVAFSLRLCREVHRIYADYQEGQVPASDPVLAGLALSFEVLGTLGNTVRGGMPAMRISVASAETREMLAVLFGEDPLAGPARGERRERFLSIVNESAAALALPEAPSAGPQANEAPATAPDESPEPDPAPEPAGRPKRRWRLFRRRSG